MLSIPCRKGLAKEVFAAEARLESPKKRPSPDSSTWLDSSSPGNSGGGCGKTLDLIHGALGSHREFYTGQWHSQSMHSFNSHFSCVPDPSEDAGGTEVADPVPGLEGTFRDAGSECKEIGLTEGVSRAVARKGRKNIAVGSGKASWSGEIFKLGH